MPGVSKCLTRAGALHTVRQQAIPLIYKGTRMEVGFQADLIVDDKVTVEIKSIEAVHKLPSHASAPPAARAVRDRITRRNLKQ